MARRLPSSNSDSLELLLDTMCNTFGGIILIALLIALLARDVKVSREQDATALKTQMTERRLQRARDDLANAQHYRDRLAAANPDIEKRRRLMEEKNAKLQELANLNRKPTTPGPPTPGATAEQKAQTLQEKLAARMKEEADVNNQIDAVEKEIRDAQSETSQTKNRSRGRTVKLRLPRERKTGKDPAGVILCHKQIYPLEYRHGEQVSRNEAGLTWKPIEIGGMTIGREVQPIRGRGLLVNNAAALQQWLNGFPASRFAIVFIVYDDSFAEFQAVKQFVVTRGYEYGWEPLPTGDPVRFSSGGRSVGVQ